MVNLSHRPVVSRRARYGASVAAVALHALLFAGLYGAHGLALLGTLSLMPVLVVALLLGRWAGAAAGVVLFVVNSALVLAADGPPLSDLFAGRALGNYAVLVVVGGFVGWLRDLNARAQSQARLLAAREGELRHVFEHSAVGLSRVDTAGRILDVNPALARMLGYARDEVVGRTFSAFTVPEDAAASRSLFAELVSGRRTHYTQEKQYVRSDGELVWGEATVTGVPGPDGHPVLFVGVVQDVTARKEAERQAAFIAQTEKLRALGHLAGGAAHDLNQSLGIVAGFAELASVELTREAPDLDAARRMLGTVARAAMDGGETVKRLLVFGRREEEGPPERLELAALLHDVAYLTAPRWSDDTQVQGRPVALSVEASEELPVLGHAAALRQALTNLVFNAVDALPRGGRIRLGARREGDRVVVEVADDGVGMTAEVQARVFEPFFTTKGGRGTGLGLSQVFAIVERHGGRIDVTSAPGAGTTFAISLPGAGAGDPAGPSSLDPGACAVPERAAATPLRVLLVDDERRFGEMAATMLSADGHAVAVATSGEEALARLEAEEFDVVVSDLGMGAGINGWELTERVRWRWPDVRVVLATGWGTEIDPETARRRGVDAVLAKPYRSAELRRAVQAEARNRAHGSSGAAP